MAKPTGGWCKIYPVVELERIKAEMRAAPAKLLEGLVERAEAWRMFGITKTTWQRWRRAGRLPRGKLIRLPDERVYRRVYPRDELERLLDELNRLSKPYPDPERPGCHRVPVMSFWTVVCEAIIDDEALPLVVGKRWNWIERSDHYEGAVVLASSEGTHSTLHGIILGLVGTPFCVTHANGNPLDCRRANLIVRNPSERSASARKMATQRGQPCTSRFKGVSWEPSRGKWRVSIKKEDQFRFLGRFEDEIAAAQTYDEAALELFGEHARLNFPDGVDAWLEQDASASAGQGERAAA